MLVRQEFKGSVEAAMAPRELCMDWVEKHQGQLRMCQDMWRAVDEGRITKEEYDHHKRKLILALSKPVAGSQHAASAPSRLALLTELKNSGCILEIEYQWARVPILCQVDLVRQPRKENREPAENKYRIPPDKEDKRAGVLKAPRISASSSPLGPSKHGPNVEGSSQHPMAPWTKEAFLLRRAALSGDESQPSNGKQVKRQPSFAGLGQARRSASFSAGDSVASDASNRKPIPPKKDLRSSFSLTSSPIPQPARKSFRRSLSFSSERPEEAYESVSLDKQTSNNDGQEPLQGGSFIPRLPPLARTRRPSLLGSATGLVRKSRKGSYTLDSSLTDAEAGQRLASATDSNKGARVDFDQKDLRKRVWESEPETCTKGEGVTSRKRLEEANMQVKRSFWSEDEGSGIEQDVAHTKESRLRQGGCKDDKEALRQNRGRDESRGRKGEALSASAQTKHGAANKGLPRGIPLANGCESFEESSQQSDSCEDKTGWFDKLKVTGTCKEQTTGVVHKNRVKTEAFHSAESGFESTGGSQDEVSRVKNRTASKVARRLVGSGHVLLKGWNRKLAGLMRDKQAGESVSASEEEGARVSGCRSGEGPSSRHQELRRRVYHTLDTWRHEACGRQSPKRFLTDAQMTHIAEVLPQSTDELQPLLPQPWIDRYGPYVLRIVRDILDTAHVPAEKSARVTLATSAGPPRRAPPETHKSARVTSAASAGPPRRPPPPLPMSTSECITSSETDRSITSQSDAKAKRHSTWARRKRTALEVEVTRLPIMTEESDEDLDVFSPGTGPLPRERLGNPRAGHACRREYLRKSQEKSLRRSLDNLCKIKAGDWT